VIEIKFRGRGGQGAVMASEILGRAFFLEGKYPQCFSLFGGERRGAPVTGFLRVDKEPILLKCQIKRADHLILFDLSLVDEQELLNEVKPGGLILLHTEKEIHAFTRLRRFKIGLIEAGALAREVGLGETFNIVMLGAYAAVAEALCVESLVRAVKTMVPGKVEANLKALQEGYQKVKIFEREELTDDKSGMD
jgi:2-oxoisovalerate ferredoxin oxidoreductase gamma subunit